jgi:uncharacterized protein (TIGR03437 family)
MVVDSSGNTYVAGTSSSPQLAPSGNATNAGPDFVLALDRSGSRIRLPLHLPQSTVTVLPELDLSPVPNLQLIGAQNALLTVPTSYGADSPAIAGFANAASLAPNTGWYPGALVKLFGIDVPSPAQGLQVMVNGIPAPILFASPTQVNLQVPFNNGDPYGLAQVVVMSAVGNVSAQLPVGRSVGIFTTDGVHAAAINQDGTVNSVDNPANAGSIVSLYGTGAIWPSGVQDGAISVSPLPLYLSTFEAYDWSGAPLYVSYAGAAPGLIDGVFQINVQAPQISSLPGFKPWIMLKSGSLTSNVGQIYLK